MMLDLVIISSWVVKKGFILNDLCISLSLSLDYIKAYDGWFVETTY